MQEPLRGDVANHGEARSPTIGENPTEYAAHDEQSFVAGEVDRSWWRNLDMRSGTGQRQLIDSSAYHNHGGHPSRGEGLQSLGRPSTPPRTHDGSDFGDLCGTGYDSTEPLPPPPPPPEDLDDGRSGVVTTAPTVVEPLPSESYEAITKQEIVTEAVTKSRFLRLLERYCEEKRRLNLQNLTTILQKTGKLRLSLPSSIVAYLDAAFKDPICRDDFLNSRQLGNAISGFACLENSIEARQLMATLTLFVRESAENFQPQDISQAFKGLEQMQDSDEARRLVSALNIKVVKCQHELPGQIISDCLHGVSQMGLSEEVRFLLATIASKISRSRGSLKRKHVEKMTQSLLILGENAPEVKEVIEALELKKEA